MGERTNIEWTEASWNPIRARRRDTGKAGWYCGKVSAGCANCYAEAMNRWRGTRLPYKPGHLDELEIVLDERALLLPLRWRTPRKIFVCSMTDLFGDWVLDAWLDRIFAVAALCPQHTFQVLTKRPDRMRAYLSGAVNGRAASIAAEIAPIGRPIAAANLMFAPGRKPDMFFDPWPLPNVWLGTSCEDQATADARVPELLATPAAIRFVSAEPLLGPIDFQTIDDGLRDGVRLTFDALTGLACDGEEVILGIFGSPDPRLDWIIVGSESGTRARPCDLAWVRSIRDQCVTAGVPLFWKQHVEGKQKISLPQLDGRTWAELPRSTSAS